MQKCSCTVWEMHCMKNTFLWLVFGFAKNGQDEGYCFIFVPDKNIKNISMTATRMRLMAVSYQHFGDGTTKKIPRSYALWTNLLNCWGGTFLMFVWLLFLPSYIYTSESLRNQKKSSAGRTSTHFQRFTKLSYYVGYSNWITTQNLLKFAYLSRICYSI